MMETVVVGIDRTAASHAALRWAVKHAEALHARLLLVHAFDVPDVPLDSDTGFPVHDEEELRAAAQAHLRTLAAAAGAPPGTATRVVRERLPARALLEEAADADLLVVGFSGRGGLARLVLGSVSQQCLQHAPCPTVVVPAQVPARQLVPAGAEPAVAG
jgi:nucleotide-binding universal stress UspA family protein